MSRTASLCSIKSIIYRITRKCLALTTPMKQPNNSVKREKCGRGEAGADQLAEHVSGTGNAVLSASCAQV